MLADLADGDSSESIGFSCCSESLEYSHGLNQTIDTSTMRFRVSVRIGGCNGSDSSVRNNDDC